jgi:Tetratricopeptide repeat
VEQLTVYQLGSLASRPDAVARLPVSLPPRPTLLAGREELLAGLDVHLSVGAGGWPRLVALHGLGGAGKTSVAVEYAHRHLAEVGLAWQFPAENHEVLLAEFTRLAAQLGAREMSDAPDPVASVHAVLAAFPADWLLVFDNAAGQEAVREVLPPAGPGRVLITSQSAAWAWGQAVEVPVLGTEVAAEFLVNRTGDLDERAADDLAAELGGLPLALEQAAAYMQATGTTMAEYLLMFRDRRDDLLARGHAAGHPADVATTLGLALSRLQEQAPAAVGLARLLACLAPEPVPLARLLAGAQVADKLAPDVAATAGPLLGDRVAAGDAIAALRRYSLITPVGGGLVLVHRLVQAITLAQQSADLADRWKQAAAALVEAAIPADTALPEGWPTCAALLPHARVVLDLTSGGMWRIARYLGKSGSYPAARDLFLLIADAYTADDTYGPEHRDTLAARAQLACWTGEAGDAAGARDQYAALLPAADQVLGHKQPDTLSIRASLARWTGNAGSAAGARDQFAALLPVRQQVLGPEHPDTLAARGNLAAWTGEAGDLAGARDQLAALLPIYEQVLGPEHPDTLTTRHNLARWTGQAGDPAGARDQLAALLPIRERVMGTEHPDTLTTRHNLAYWTGEAGDAAGARDLFAALVPVAVRKLGEEHPATLLARSHLAYWVGEAGDAARARDQYAAQLPVRERVLGREHQDVLIGRAQYARLLGEAGDVVGARDAYAALLLIDERVLGKEHPHTLTARANLARWTGEAGDPVGARDQYATLLPLREQVLGPEHQQTLYARRDLARWTGEAGDAAGARDQYAALLPVIERVSGPEHSETQEVRDDLAYWTSRARLRRGVK